MEAPVLIESNAKKYLFDSLHNCHVTRVNMYYYVFNVGILVLFLGVFGLAIYYSGKTKLNDYEKQEKMYRDQQYVLSKIRYYKEHEKNTAQSSHSSITNLPTVNHYPALRVWGFEGFDSTNIINRIKLNPFCTIHRMYKSYRQNQNQHHHQNEYIPSFTHGDYPPYTDF